MAKRPSPPNLRPHPCHKFWSKKCKLKIFWNSVFLFHVCANQISLFYIFEYIWIIWSFNLTIDFTFTMFCQHGLLLIELTVQTSPYSIKQEASWLGFDPFRSLFISIVLWWECTSLRKILFVKYNSLKNLLYVL